MGLFGWKKKTETFVSPMTGEVIPMEQVPDPVFAQKVMGDGFAVLPSDGTVIAPISGTIEAAFPTGHAFGIKSEDGTEILIHIGIDTVNLDGQGFEVMVKQGDEVKQGDILVKVDLDYVKRQGKSIASPVIFTSGETISLLKTGRVDAGEGNVVKIKKQ